MSALTETKKSFRVFAKSIWDNGWPFRSSVKVELLFSDLPTSDSLFSAICGSLLF